MDALGGDDTIRSSTSASDTLAPTEIEVMASGRALRLRWPDDIEARLSSARLREACRCAHCLAAARRGQPVSAPADVTVCDVRPCGTNAVNIQFSDGHGRGIYPFGYLAILAAQCVAESA